MRRFAVYCGNLDCPTRRETPPRLFDVYDYELPDGELWLCPDCKRQAKAS